MLWLYLNTQFKEEMKLKGSKKKKEKEKTAMHLCAPESTRFVYSYIYEVTDIYILFPLFQCGSPLSSWLNMEHTRGPAAH